MNTMSTSSFHNQVFSVSPDTSFFQGMDIHGVVPEDLTDWTFTVWSAYDAVKAWANEEIGKPEIPVETTNIATAVSDKALTTHSG